MGGFIIGTILEIKDLSKHFIVGKSYIFSNNKKLLKAVDKVSLKIEEGETVGLVDESGCGKTTCGRTILKIHEPTSGEIIFKGNNIEGLNKNQMLPYRKQMQMIFQDPYASLEPRMMVGDAISEGMFAHDKKLSKKEAKEIVHSLLVKVGLNSEHASRYPHEFSGGQRQRIGIARALALNPSFIVCDEPISALDVSIQAQVINLLEEFQETMGLTYLFIAHDLSMVKHISNRIGVMYLGNLVELGESNEVYNKPLHPYTKALLSAVPLPDPIEAKNHKRIILDGDVPSPIDIPTGCCFSGRCPNVMPICKEEKPKLVDVAPDHLVACFLYKK